MGIEKTWMGLHNAWLSQYERFERNGNKERRPLGQNFY